jgi:hypothetical protein
MRHPTNDRCWLNAEAQVTFFSVSFGEISWFWRENFQTFDLAVAIRGNLAKADAENAFTSGGYRPISDTYPIR